MRITSELASRVLSVVDAGLCKGLGAPTPGAMCVEAAVCYALGEPHSDSPSCVHSAVRGFKIRLNDSAWPDNAARARGMRALAIAQLGSNTIDGARFARIVALQTVKRLIAKLCREILGREDLAAACAQVTDLDKARYAARAASYAADAASYAADAASYAADAAFYAARAASDAADAADAASDAAPDPARLEYLTLAANIGLEALIECGSPGCEYLDLLG